MMMSYIQQLTVVMMVDQMAVDQMIFSFILITGEDVCYNIVFPVTVVDTDGNTTTVDNIEAYF